MLYKRYVSGHRLTHIRPRPYLYLIAKNLNENGSDLTFPHLFTLTSSKSHFVEKENLRTFSHVHFLGIE